MMENIEVRLNELNNEIKFLKNNLDLVNALIDSSVDWELLLLPSGKFMYCSPSCKNITGYDASKFLEHPEFFLEIVHNEDKELVINHFDQKKLGLDVENKIEFRIITKNGEEKWIEHICGKAYHSNGDFIGYRSSNRDITERKQLEQKLINVNNALFQERQLFTEGNVIVFKWKNTDNWPVEYVSQNIQNILGFTPEEILSENFVYFSLIHPADLERVIQEVTNYSNQRLKSFQHKPYRVFDKKGQTHWVLDYTNIIYNKNGEITHYFGYIVDITEQKIIEEKLRESEARNKALLDAIPDMMFVLDKNGIFIDYYAENKKELLAQPEFFLGKNVSEVLPPDVAELAISSLKQVFETGEKSVFTYHLEIENKLKYFESRLLPYGDNKVLSLVRDITDIKVAEEKLIENEANLRALIEGTNDSIWAFNRNYEIVYINPTFQNDFLMSFGVKLEIGSNLLASLPIDIQPIWKQRCDRALANEQFTVEDAVETNLGMVYIEVSFNPIIKNGEVIGCSCFGRNITERKKAEQELILAKEKAEEHDRLKSAFLANMSHEIRTPMNGILGFAQLLKEPNLSEEEKLEYVEMIEKSGQRMLNILNDILDISKIEAGVIQITKQQININEKIKFIYNFFKIEVENRGLDFSYRIALPDYLAIIITDRDKLFAIITNLIKNAIQYTEKGSIEFGYTKKGNELEFFVKDTGIGIPKDRQVAIFERFIQADIDDKMARQGAGLGLAIAKAYVELLGGRIWVESEEGVGSTFYFTLPYNNNEEYNSFENNRENTMQNDENIKLKIMVVEDDNASQKLLKKLVENYTKEIIIVDNGSEAIETCRNNPDIDLILMDMRIPQINGYEATRKIREFNKDVIIIAQTAFGLSGDREKSIEAGCNDYISKPINREKLNELIHKYFSQKKS